jgi:hypothetical protein
MGTFGSNYYSQLLFSCTASNKSGDLGLQFINGDTLKFAWGGKKAKTIDFGSCALKIGGASGLTGQVWISLDAGLGTKGAWFAFKNGILVGISSTQYSTSTYPVL